MGSGFSRRSFLPGAILLVASLALWVAWPGGLAAQGRIGFVGVRSRPDICSDWLMTQVTQILEQRLAQQLGPALVPPALLVRAIGSPLALNSCQEDGCMALLGQTAGVQQVVWGFLDRPTPTGFVLSLRTVSVPQGTVLREARPACSPCDEAAWLSLLVAATPSVLGLPGSTLPGPPPGAAAAADASSSAKVLQIPGVHRPLSPEEEARAGWLSLTTEPPGATLSLFSYSVGATPLNNLRLLPGAYPGILRLAGYADQPLTIGIRPGQETRLASRLTATGVQLRVVTVPLEAQVLLDGQPVGKTPLSEALLPLGPHQVRVVLEGYQPVERTVVGTIGQPVELSMTLEPIRQAEGTLTIRSQPPSASILLDDEPVGQSPVKRRVSAGAHSVSGYLPGYSLAEQRVEVQPGTETRVTLKLSVAAENRTTLTVRSVPAGAEIVIGALKLGRTPVEGIKFKPGRHVLRLFREGFPTYELPFQLQENQQLVLDADLRKGPPLQDGLLLDQ